MNIKFNKITRLLCFLFISIFIIGIGGEVVKAESVVIHTEGKIQFRPNSTYYQYLKTSDGLDAFCLNGRSKAPKGQTLPLIPDLLDESMARKIGAIIAASDGLTDDNGKKLSDAESYYITQAAIWYVKEGIQPAGTGHPLTQGFYNWLTSNRSDAWNILIDAANKEVDRTEPLLQIKGSSDNKLTVEGDYLVSSPLIIHATGGIFEFSNYTVSVDSDSAEETCIEYGGACTNSASIPNNAEFIVKVKKPTDESGDVNASISIVSEKESTMNTVKTYGSVTSNGFQNVAVLTSKPITLSDKLSFHGEYKNSKKVEIQKLDAEKIKNGKSEDESKVAGATLEVRDSSGAVVGTYESTGSGEANPILNLPVGEYTLVEKKSPNGYILNTNPIKFLIVQEDGNLVVKQGDKTVTSATISVENAPLKVKFIKKDNNGKTVEGVKITITGVNAVGAGNSDPWPILCAITDSKGELTIPCDDGSTSSDIVKKDGIYILGVDFSNTEEMYEIVEEAAPGYVFDQYAIDEFNSFYPGYPHAFAIHGYDVTVFNPYIKYEISNEEIPVITMTFENQGYIDIGKTNITTGAEIAGAHLIVSDPSVPVDTNEDKGSDNVIDEWISEEGKTHKIVGIKHNYIYELKEIIAPEGYVSIATSIYFKMDENGNVTTYEDKEGTKPITDLKGTDYELLIPNDYTKVKISKTDVTGEKEIPGAELKICTALSYETSGNACIPDKPEWSWTSSDEAYEIDMLPLGKYYLIETLAPEGYARQTNAVEFQVVESGDVLTVKFENKPTKVYISKRDFTTGEELPGAQLKILKADGTPAYDANGNLLEWVSGTEPHYIERLPIGNYILVETIYPEGYQEGMIIDGVVTTEYAFSITDEEYEIEIIVYNETIKAPNTGISTLNLFAIGALMVFVGYQTIRIYRRKAING